MIIYVQKTGNMYHDRELLFTGYSGNGRGLNNPDDQYVEDVGPAPTGEYNLSAPFTHVRAGPFTMRLKPVDISAMHGRDGIMLHGDNQAMNHTASDGCIIGPYAGRVAVAHLATDRKILVVGTEEEYLDSLGIPRPPKGLLSASPDGKTLLVNQSFFNSGAVSALTTETGGSPVNYPGTAPLPRSASPTDVGPMPEVTADDLNAAELAKDAG